MRICQIPLANNLPRHNRQTGDGKILVKLFGRLFSGSLELQGQGGNARRFHSQKVGVHLFGCANFGFERVRKLKYRRLGNSGLKVSELGLGSWRTYGHSVDLQETTKCVHAALDGGINFFDTADTYGNGEAERFFGKTFESVPRDRFVVSTKCYFPTSDSANGRGLSRKHIVEAVKKSLKNFQMDHIDLLLCHRYDDETPLNETVQALSDLIRQGHLLYWGVSRWTGDQIDVGVEMAKSIGANTPIGHQHWYNMLNTMPEESLFARSERAGLGMIAYSPLAQGVLTGKYEPGVKANQGTRASDEEGVKMMWDFNDKALAFAKELKTIVERNEFSLPSVALAWCLRRKEVSSVIMGASSAQQLSGNLSGYLRTVPSALLEEIDNLIRLKWRKE